MIEFIYYFYFIVDYNFHYRIIHVSLNKIEISNQENKFQKFSLLRRDIVDKNGTLISKHKSYHAAINQN